MDKFLPSDSWVAQHKVYLITNKMDGKKYVGKTSAKYLSERFGNHKSRARIGCDTYLYRSMRKHGLDAFDVSVLSLCDSNEWASYFEKLWILLLDTRNKEVGYNTKDGGDGARHSQETREKISRIQRENPRSPEVVAKFQKAGHSAEAATKRANTLREGYASGRLSHKSNSEAMKAAWATGKFSGTTGTKATDSRKQKVSASLKEFWSKPEAETARETLSEKTRERWTDPIYKAELSAKISAAKRAKA